MLAQPLGDGDLEQRRQPTVVLARAGGKHLPVQQVAIGLGGEGLDDVAQPVGRDDAVVVREGEDLALGAADAVVVRP